LGRPRPEGLSESNANVVDALVCYTPARAGTTMNDDTELRAETNPTRDFLSPLEPPALLAEPLTAIRPAILADLMLACPLTHKADLATLEPREDAHVLRVKRGDATLAERWVPADVGHAAIVRLALIAGLDPLVDASSPEGTSNSAKVAIRAGSDTAESLISIRASAAGLDAELRALAVNGRAIEPRSGGQLKHCQRCHAFQAPQHRVCEIDGGALADVEDDPSPGGVVGTYLVRARLGTGGSGAVFSAEHALIGRPAAVKVLRMSAAGAPLLARRFLSEARAACRVRHPNLVEVIDYGLLRDGRPFIVMERLAGEPLSARLARSGALAPLAALRLAREVALGLGAAHDSGVVHNDVKPSNIMLLEGSQDQAPRLKLIDFGAASPLGDAGDDGEWIVGTPGYLAPERVRGEPADGRADLYALGVVLYEMLSGSNPWKTIPSAHLLQTIRALSPPPLTSPFGVLPRPVIRLVARALAVEPDERHQTAREMAADLEHAALVLDREGFRRWLP
jgi:tRNA A-37 threonylcarbamoyl transferase component Bud32